MIFGDKLLSHEVQAVYSSELQN